MNAAGFYVCAVLVVLSCAAAVGLRAPRDTAVAAGCAALAVGLFLAVAGEYVLAVLEAAVLLATLLGMAVAARRGAFGPRGAPLSLSGWQYGLGVAVLALVILDGTALAAGGHWYRGGSTAGLATVAFGLAPAAAALLGVAAVAAVSTALVIGRVSDDEMEQEERRRARRDREERMRRRREDRAAARRRRDPAGSTTPAGTRGAG
jgi:O-antigen ligase